MSVSPRAAIDALRRAAEKMGVGDNVGEKGPHLIETHRHVELNAAALRAKAMPNDRLHQLAEGADSMAYGAVVELADRGDEDCRQRLLVYHQQEAGKWAEMDVFQLFHLGRVMDLRRKWYPDTMPTKEELWKTQIAEWEKSNKASSA